MKVYISAHHPDPANELSDALTAAGHQVLSTWHRDGPRPDISDEPAWAEKACDNFDLIDKVDALILIASLAHISGTNRVAGGKFVEAGYALGVEKRVYTLGGVENGMMHAALNVADVAELLKEMTD